MTTELQQKLSAIKAECQRAIELGEKATPGPWYWDESTRVDPRVALIGNDHGGIGDVVLIQSKETKWNIHPSDEAIIAHSRTFSPAAAKGLLAMIEEAERCLAHHPMDIDEDHHAAIRILQSLAESWGEGKG